MAETNQTPYTDEDLFAHREQRSFTGDSLKEIAFPLGGIGTGNVSLGGRGNLRDWEIFNRPGKGRVLPYTFPAIFTRTASGNTLARVLESKLLPPFAVGSGMPPDQVCGLPRLEKATFKGEYPFAWIIFKDSSLPVRIELEAFNPFVPLNEKDSAIPVAILKYRLTNIVSERVDATVCWSMMNPCGFDGTYTPGRRGDAFGGQKNDFVDEGAFRGIRMTQSKHPVEDVKFGSCALVTTHKNVTYLEAWTRSGWWDDAQAFWDDFRADGDLTDNGVHDPSPDNTADVASLGLKVSLAPGETVELPFIFTWYFPNRENYWNREEEVRGARLRNRYADLWNDAWDVASYVVANLGRLEKETSEFRDALYKSTLPAVALDAAGANMSIMRTTTCVWLDDDRFYGFEGCNDVAGCCPMNCTHVWNYEQAVAFLFPPLERTMRLTDFTTNVEPSGKMAFRPHVPLGRTLHKFHAAADGQMGCILKLYREYLMSGDLDFLRNLYPGAKRSMEYVWTEWDKDRDGVMEGVQHNTYDIEFVGANTMMGTLYLGALKAMEKIAAILDDQEFSAYCAELFQSGFQKHSEKLFNGEFFVQDCDVETAPRHQYGQGCLSDQLLGQWFCEVVRLGHVLPPNEVRSALEAIFRYNWRPDLSTHESVQRTYALNNEAGLLLCTWPNGGRPRFPFSYADEVWTGIEYQVAAHLIYEGFLDEGLAIVKGIRDRHDGVSRNPWNEFECGHHYARAMASWSVILALTGFHYSAPDRLIAFGPKVNAADFRSFYSTGSCWGIYSQRLVEGCFSAKISVSWGEVELQKIELDVPSDYVCRSVRASIGAKDLAPLFEKNGDRLVVTLGDSAKISVGEALEIVAQS
ncbi:MAG: non-lysosomal glucosylceramidase [Armatimonadetes bacterium]|nr:non-lysosomal glucosylceramidase [Armatimonadota bacterium]